MIAKASVTVYDALLSLAERRITNMKRTCLICGKKMRENLCTCGYDMSKAYEYYRTLATISDNTISTYQERKEYEIVIKSDLKTSSTNYNQRASVDSNSANDSLKHNRKRNKANIVICIIIGVFILSILGYGIYKQCVYNLNNREAEKEEAHVLTTNDNTEEFVYNSNNREAEKEETHALTTNDNTENFVYNSNNKEEKKEEVHVPTMDDSTEDLFMEINYSYDKLWDMKENDIDMSVIQEKYQHCDIDGDNQDDHLIMNINHETYDLDMKIQFGNGVVLDIPKEGPGGAIISRYSYYVVDLQWEDIDSDGVNEILVKYWTMSTAGTRCEGYVFNKTQDGNWNIVDDTSKYLMDCVDIELIYDGVIVLHDGGEKISTEQYYDYVGIRYVNKGDFLYEVEQSKALARQYWPHEYWDQDTSNHEDYDFKITDEELNLIKETLNVQEDCEVTVGKIFYNERNNRYLKEITFTDLDGGYLYSIFLDKDYNLIDFMDL